MYLFPVIGIPPFVIFIFEYKSLIRPMELQAKRRKTAKITFEK